MPGEVLLLPDRPAPPVTVHLGSVTGQAALYELSFFDSSANKRIFLRTQIPQGAGAGESATVTLPFRHVTGQINLKALDNVGNESALSSVSVALDPALVDPYVPAEGAAAPLTSGGTPLRCALWYAWLATISAIRLRRS